MSAGGLRMSARIVPKLLTSLAGVIAAGSLSFTTPAAARITKIVIDSTTTPTIGGVQYTQKYGRIFGELDPADSHNTIIQDIGLAPLDANSKVPYVATITILQPN